MNFCPALVLLPALSLCLQAETDLEQAARLMKVRKYPAAQALVDKALKANPQDAEALVLAGNLQMRQGNFAKAQTLADEALKLQPNRSGAHLLRGNAIGAQIATAGMLKKMSMASEVRGHFEKAVQAEPRNREARQALFGYYLQAPGVAGGGLDKAQAFADQTLGLDPALGHTFKGRLHQQKKDLGAAQAAYRQAIAADPKFGQPLNEIGYVELAMKQVDYAIGHFQQLTAVEPEDPNSHDSLGDGFMAKGSLDEAIAAYRKAVALEPTFSPSLLHLAEALEKKGQKDEAIQAYRRCAELPKGGRFSKQAKERLKALGQA